MPTKKVAAGTSRPRTPGLWLCRVPERYERGGKPRDGIEVLDDHGGPLKTAKGDEMWRIRYEVVDDHPSAPRGEIIFDQLIWSENAQARAQTLLDVMGVYDSLPDGADIEKHHFYNHNFCVLTFINDRGYLEPDGYACFFPPTAERGPVAVKPGRPAAATVAASGLDIPF